MIEVIHQLLKVGATTAYKRRVETDYIYFDLKKKEFIEQEKYEKAGEIRKEWQKCRNIMYHSDILISEALDTIDELDKDGEFVFVQDFFPLNDLQFNLKIDDENH